MNICQISSQDLLHCLVPGRLSEMPFFQQVLAIAEAEHLVSISDYAIGQFLEAKLPAADQKQLESLLEVIDIWQTDPADYEAAIALSQKKRMSIGDAIDHIIYANLCPDWLLVAESTRNLPNATGIASFWQEWIDIRDDLPPDGGSIVPRPTGGGGPSGNSQNYDRSTSTDAINANTSQLAAFNSSVLFNQSYDRISDGQPTQGKALIALGENQPAAAATQLVQSLQAALPNLEIHLQQTDSGWSVVIEQRSGQPVKTLTLAQLAGDQAAMVSAALSQIAAQAQLAPGLVASANPSANSSGGTIDQAIQAAMNAQNLPIQGTPGNDVIYLSQATVAVDGGGGIDWVSYGQSPTGVTIDLGANGPVKNVENLEGSNFNDRLSGDQSDNVIIGRGGNDTLIGNAGNDILKGGSGNNQFIGGPAVVSPTAILPAPTVTPPPFITPGIKPGIKPGVIMATSGTTGFTTTSGTDMVTDDGTAMAGPLPAIRDDDWIFAGSGDDVINAGDGNNFISAGTGDNTIDSGSGQDLFVLESGPGVTQILRYQSHDKFGLLGGYHYDDLVITAAKTTANATQIRLKSATGEGDLLAIVIGVTPAQLDRSAFLTVQYDLPDSKNTANGSTQVIPDWLMASQQQGQTLHVPTLSQLAPTLRALPTFDVPRAS
jgi:Ca2+-binding RTX toxin-like protein